MVDVLKMNTQAHAPLSQAQTIKVFQSLEDQNRETQRKLDDFMRSVNANKEGVGDNAMDLRVLRAAVETVQEELVKANTRMSAMRVDVLGNAANVVVLQEQSGKANENVKQLREGQKLTNTNVHNLREDHLQAKEEIRKLQKEIAALKEAKENVLQAKLDHVILAMSQVQEDQEAIKMRTFNNQDGVRKLVDALQDTKADVVKLAKAKADHEKRLSELLISTDSNKENLELTNGVVMRVHTEHEETRSKSLVNFNKNHELDVGLQRLRDDHSHVVHSVQIVEAELSKLAASQDTNRDRINEAMGDVRSLKGGAANMRNFMQDLSRTIEKVNGVALTTEENLKMTNSLVLPNLGAEGSFSPSVVGNSTIATTATLNSSRGNDMDSVHGLGRTYKSSPRGRGSPRRRKENAWHARNIGSVPDRMAWI